MVCNSLWEYPIATGCFSTGCNKNCSIFISDGEAAPGHNDGNLGNVSEEPAMSDIGKQESLKSKSSNRLGILLNVDVDDVIISEEVIE